jgi:hypothetical protein
VNLSRILSLAVFGPRPARKAPVPPPTMEELADALGLQRVESYTRRPPSNPKREAVLADLRALRAARSVPTEGQASSCSSGVRA